MTTDYPFLSGSMAPHQFFALIACVLCLGLGTIAVHQTTTDDAPSSTAQTVEVTPPPAPAQPIRL